MSGSLSAFADLDPARLPSAYLRLWFELTIGGRAIWSDESLSDAQKLDGLKWVNELQHRVWHAHQGTPGYDVDQLAEFVEIYSNKAPVLRGIVKFCADRAAERSADTKP